MPNDSETFKVGDRVRILKETVIDGEGMFPNVPVLTTDTLIIREVKDGPWSDYSVAHEDATGSFGVKASEIKAIVTEAKQP